MRVGKIILAISITMILLLNVSVMANDKTVSLNTETEGKSEKTWTESWEDEKFEDFGDGVESGMWWCLSPKSRCYTKMRKRFVKRYETFKTWFIKYAAGMIPAHIAMTSTTEAPAGPHQCSPDKKLKECGLMGTKYLMAKQCNVNICDPEAAIWCSAHMANKRRLAAFKKYPELKMAPARDQYFIGGMTGGIGPIASLIILKSGALKTISDGKGGKKLRFESPLDRIFFWLKSPRQKPTSLIEAVENSRLTQKKIGYRIGRGYAVDQHLRWFYGVKEFDEMPRGEFKLIKRPKHLPEYPGDERHGKCKDHFSEMIKHKP